MFEMSLAMEDGRHLYIIEHKWRLKKNTNIL